MLKPDHAMSSPRTPLVIGGLGGSGTRVVTEIVMKLGWDMGKDLNQSLDELLFTLLFKRPSWYQSACSHEPEVFSLLESYEWLRSGRSPRKSDWSKLFSAVRDMATHGPGYNRGLHLPAMKRIFMHRTWPWIRIAHLYYGNTSAAARWGWKEPNSHIYLPFLIKQFPTLRYIHVIRHGLDMVFNKNNAQFYNWSNLYGIDSQQLPDEKALRHRLLEFWVKANTSTITHAKTNMSERFLLVNFDSLCDRPLATIKEICTFLGADGSGESLEALSKIPIRPLSARQYQQHPIDGFSPALLESVRQLGFKIYDE